MDKEIQTWLFDILQSIEEVESYFEDNQRVLKFIGMISKQNVPLKGISK